MPLVSAVWKKKYYDSFTFATFLYMNINEKNTEINRDRKHNKGLNFANRLH